MRARGGNKIFDNRPLVAMMAGPQDGKRGTAARVGHRIHLASPEYRGEELPLKGWETHTRECRGPGIGFCKLSR
jgi:hypothetical protein